MIIWILFFVLITTFLAIDLGVFNKTPHDVSAKEALTWTSVWVGVSLSFGVVIFFAYENTWIAHDGTLDGKLAVLKYLTGYLLEYSLSMDNIFVIALIFNYFKIPKSYQHRVLFWGIIGAVIFRGLMIAVGVALIHRFQWMTYLLGLMLIYSAYKMLRSGEVEVDPNHNAVVRLFRKVFPVTKTFYRDQFFVKRKYITAATPLFVALIVVETTDILFAIDSIPAILSITTDPFLVFSSNIFAILGLRSLYFVLAAMLDKFSLLKYSLVFILAFVGVKMLIAHWYHFEEWVSLAIVLAALLLGIGASLYINRDKKS